MTIIATMAKTTRSCPSTIPPRIGIKLLKHGTLKTYPGFPHGMATTHADVINPDLLAFIQS